MGQLEQQTKDENEESGQRIILEEGKCVLREAAARTGRAFAALEMRLCRLRRKGLATTALI
jgi:hypothetical protein